MNIPLALITSTALFNTTALAADPEWPPLNANESRREIPVSIGGALFFSGRYVYEVPRYGLDNFHRTDSYHQDYFEWWAQVPIGDPNGINAQIRRQPSPVTGTLPALPSLPPVKKLSPATPAKSSTPFPPQRAPALPPPSPIVQVPPLTAPTSPQLPNLPSLPPLP